jgi:hypothetical protein
LLNCLINPNGEYIGCYLRYGMFDWMSLDCAISKWSEWGTNWHRSHQAFQRVQLRYQDYTKEATWEKPHSFSTFSMFKEPKNNMVNESILAQFDVCNIQRCKCLVWNGIFYLYQDLVGFQVVGTTVRRKRKKSELHTCINKALPRTNQGGRNVLIINFNLSNHNVMNLQITLDAHS